MAGTIKANDKLPRGSYFYIQVGDRIYAGEQLETTNVERRVPPPPYDDFRSYSYIRRGTSKARSQRDKRKGTTPNYLKPYRRADPIICKELTGYKNPRLVDTVEQAKQFRKKESALKACKRLESVYSELDIKVSVKLHEGEVQ